MNRSMSKSRGKKTCSVRGRWSKAGCSRRNTPRGDEYASPVVFLFPRLLSLSLDRVSAAVFLFLPVSSRKKKPVLPGDAAMRRSRFGGCRAYARQPTHGGLQSLCVVVGLTSARMWLGPHGEHVASGLYTSLLRGISTFPHALKYH